MKKKDYNAFALIYRPGAQTACEDLARAIAFLHENAEKLQIDMTDYSLWGGSAGARMAAWLGSFIGVVILAMVIMVYIYFSKPGRDEKKNQQTINQVQTVQQKTDEKKENT